MTGLTAGRIEKYVPLIATLRTYKKEYVKNDLIAALTVAVIAIPQSMAYAIIAGVNPVYGLYTAIVSTIISSVFGSSNHLIAGPTNAIALLVAGGMRDYISTDNFYERLFLLTFIVGVLQVLFGVIKLGKAINYVSHSVIVGFTAGAGVLIGLGQLNQLFGIPLDGGYLFPIQKIYRVIISLNKTNMYALGLGVLTIAVIILCRRINKNLPGALLGIIISVILVMLFSPDNSSVDNFSVKLVGKIPSVIPTFRMLHFRLDMIRQMFGRAFPIAVIGLVEAISIAKSIASTSKEKIDANQEFIGQGLANAISSFFQCFPSSGSFTRSAINYISGAKTRLAGIASGIIFGLILLFFAPYAEFIPIPSLAGVIMVIAYNMVNRKEMKKLSKTSRSDSIVMWVTFAATVVMPDLDWAIYMGIAISIMLYLKDTNTVPVKILIPIQEETNRFCEREADFIKDKVDILIIQLEGNLYFGSSSSLESKLEAIKDKAKVFILRMKTVQTIDVTALDVIKGFIRQVKNSGGSIIVCGLRSGLNMMLVNSDLADEIGRENIFMAEDEIFASSSKALKRAKEKLYAATHNTGQTFI